MPNGEKMEVEEVSNLVLEYMHTKIHKVMKSIYLHI